MISVQPIRLSYDAERRTRTDVASRLDRKAGPTVQ